MPILTILLALLIHGATAKQQKAPALRISHLAGNFYIYTTYRMLGDAPFPSNSMYVVTPAGVVMIDTPWNAAETAPLLDSIERRHHRNVVLCVVTHFHDDRDAGLAVLRSRGIATYSTMQTSELAHAGGEPEAEHHLAGDTTFNVGGVEFSTFYPGEGHTRDNIVVWFPARRVLFGGCVVKSIEAGGLGNVNDANLESWPATIGKVMARYPNAKYVIPGHQRWSGRDALRHTLALLAKAGHS